jgi:hypothetical protein
LVVDVDIAKLRWRIERDYQELKQEVGLGHFEGRDGAASAITPGRRVPEADWRVIAAPLLKSQLSLPVSMMSRAPQVCGRSADL